MKVYMKFIFFIISSVSLAITLFTNQSNLYFSSFLQKGKYDNTEMYLRMIASENHYFGQDLKELEESFIGNVIELATNINIKDVRSLIFDEIPGLYTLTSEIIVARDGSDFTNLPIESSPPIEELMKDREVDEDSLENIDKDKPKPPIELPKKNTVFIYHSHNRESFIPHLKGTNNANTAQHKDINITLVGQRFGEKLLEKGIGAVVDTTDIAATLSERNWKYYQSYQASREVVTEALANNKDFIYLLDIHRDSSKREKTTTTINGKSYARVYFVVGSGHNNWQRNKQFAEEFYQYIIDRYPTLARGVYEKSKKEGNGVYNQDLSPNSVVIEIGGIENNLEEMYRTADLLAELFAEYYWQAAEEVSGNTN